MMIFSGPCMNNGTCIDGINEFTCRCMDGWNGTLCESTDRDICYCSVSVLSSPMQNREFNCVFPLYSSHTKAHRIGIQCLVPSTTCPAVLLCRTRTPGWVQRLSSPASASQTDLSPDITRFMRRRFPATGTCSLRWYPASREWHWRALPCPPFTLSKVKTNDKAVGLNLCQFIPWNICYWLFWLPKLWEGCHVLRFPGYLLNCGVNFTTPFSVSSVWHISCIIDYHNVFDGSTNWLIDGSTDWLIDGSTDWLISLSVLLPII